jgi:uncharacterized protein YegL
MSLVKLEQAEFAENPEPRCAVVLLLDTSGSMHGKAIEELNAGLREFESALKSDRLAALRVEVAVLTFGGSVRALDVSGGTAAGSAAGGAKDVPFDALQAFVTVDNLRLPTLTTNGETPMGEAVHRALELLRDRKDIYRRNGIDYFRPWIFLITDGKPTDKWEGAADEVKQEEARRGVLFYAVGVEKADLKTLERFSDQRPPLKLKGLAFRELFNWLSKSLSAIAQSRPGEQAALPPVGWGQVDTSH